MRRITLCLLLAALPLAACGDDDDTEAADSTTEEASDTGGSTGDYGGATGGSTDDTEAAAGDTITIETFIFDPDPITVAAGTTITVENKDTTTHTVTSGTPDAPEDTFDEELTEGSTAEISIDEPGTYVYFCQIHNSMTGEIVVE